VGSQPAVDGRSIWTTETTGVDDLLIRLADASIPARPLFVDECFKFSDLVQLFDGLDNCWTISPDGTYFVSLELTEPPRLMVVLDWFEELERLAPTN